MDLRGKKESEEISKKPEFYTFVPDKEVHIRIYGMLYIPKTLVFSIIINKFKDSLPPIY